MKKEAADLSWLPSADDWDFRSVKATECRVACHWEYAREMTGDVQPRRLRQSNDGHGPIDIDAAEGWPVIDLLMEKGAPYPKAWMAMTDAERRDILAGIPPLTSLHVHSLDEVMEEKLKRAGKKVAESLRWGNDGAYVIRPGFSAFGVEAVVKEFASWARKEAKKHDRSPRAKAAEPPFDLLKWLSVRRLDRAREKRGMSYLEAQRSLHEYRKQRRVSDPNAVFPEYASHGAWCKARSDAEKFIIEFVQDPYVLLGKLYSVF